MHSCHFGDILVTGDPWWLRPIGQLFASTGVVVPCRACCAAWVVPGCRVFRYLGPRQSTASSMSGTQEFSTRRHHLRRTSNTLRRVRSPRLFRCQGLGLLESSLWRRVPGTSRTFRTFLVDDFSYLIFLMIAPKHVFVTSFSSLDSHTRLFL